MRLAPSSLILLLAALAVAGGCQKPENAAAKERMFAPPPPDPSVARAAEKLDLGKVASDPVVRTRVLSMLFPEVHARARAGVFTVEETLSLQKGLIGSVTVEEKGSIRFNSHGDMAVELATGPTESMHLVFANEVLYLKNRAGSWRASRDPADERHFWADNTYAALRTTTEMVTDDMVLKEVGRTTVGGRPGTKFEVGLKGAPQAPEMLLDVDDAGVRTTVPVPDGGVLFELATRKRRALKGGKPQSFSGTIVLDDALAVPLSVDIQLVMKLASRKTGDEATMTINLKSTLEKLGVDEEIKPPGDAMEEISRKRVPTNPMEWMDGGLGKAARPAAGKKVTEPAPAGPPDDEEE